MSASDPKWTSELLRAWWGVESRSGEWQGEGGIIGVGVVISIAIAAPLAWKIR